MANDLKILRKLRQKEKELDRQLMEMDSRRTSNRGFQVRQSVGADSQLKRNS
jgi:hypothetical protein